MLRLLKDGHQLLKHWPRRSELALRFLLGRKVHLARFIYNWFPGLALCYLVVGWALQGGLSSALLAPVILLLGLPVQALLLLGKEAQKPLKGGDKGWFLELSDKMKARGVRPCRLPQGANYLDLAYLMEQAYSLADNAFDGPENR
ncbi:DUF412 family protein [Gallaecimonas sp. GXIMD4217]|uniref:DUF412 family protein n=1 Tax=Gallaecimonas sp. GXIMD4217 TaxID=3131927 RepID=UPI00311AC8E1